MTEYKSFYKEVGGNEGGKCHYSTRLDTYGKGCAHDCKYCYAKSLLTFRDMWDENIRRLLTLTKSINASKKFRKVLLFVLAA